MLDGSEGAAPRGCWGRQGRRLQIPVQESTDSDLVRSQPSGGNELLGKRFSDGLVRSSVTLPPHPCWRVAMAEGQARRNQRGHPLHDL